MNKQEIKELRFHLGLTQRQFAVKVGASLPAVIAWENDRNKPSERFEWKLKQLLKEV